METDSRDSCVVCVKVKDIRPRYSNLKEWMDDSDNVYIGRAGVVFIEETVDGVKKKKRYPSKPSIWCNPFKIKKDVSREQVVSEFRDYIEKKIQDEPIYLEELKKLKGKTLGCWCKPDLCHGDVLVEMIEKYC